MIKNKKTSVDFIEVGCQMFMGLLWFIILVLTIAVIPFALVFSLIYTLFSSMGSRW